MVTVWVSVVFSVPVHLCNECLIALMMVEH